MVVKMVGGQTPGFCSKQKLNSPRSGCGQERSPWLLDPVLASLFYQESVGRDPNTGQGVTEKTEL